MKRLMGACLASVLLAVACRSGAATPPQAPDPPTARMTPLAAIGDGEGQLNLIAIQGYVDPAWSSAFQQTTKCKITTRYAASPEQIASLMKDGGAGKWDMVSASGAAALGLIYSGDVQPMNTSLIPEWKNFQPAFQEPVFNTVRGVHYGISVQWGPNSLLFNTKKFPNPPTSWAVIYDPSIKGLITVADDPMQIADAALYLSKTQPKLGISDPYELTRKQFDAAVTLLKAQQPLIKQYWATPTDEIQLFDNGLVFAGPGSSYQTLQLELSDAPVADTVPTEGITGWADSWMLATRAAHPNCAYKWAAYVTTPQVQALQALTYGEAPVNTKACARMEALQSGSCGRYHANAASSYFDAIKFWKTPLATCDDGTANCVAYDEWSAAWATVKALKS
jgi:putative spermidine/putrescine transport system substrate-binding protein